MITIFPDYAKQIASRAANKAVDLTDPMRQLSSLTDVARSDDADQFLAVSLDSVAKIAPFIADLEERGGHVRYAITNGSGHPLEAAWVRVVAGKDTVDVNVLDEQDQAASAVRTADKPIKAGADYSAIRERANARPGAKPVIPVVDPADADNWED